MWVCCTPTQVCHYRHVFLGGGTQLVVGYVCETYWFPCASHTLNILLCSVVNYEIRSFLFQADCKALITFCCNFCRSSHGRSAVYAGKFGCYFVSGNLMITFVLHTVLFYFLNRPDTGYC